MYAPSTQFPVLSLQNVQHPVSLLTSGSNICTSDTITSGEERTTANTTQRVLRQRQRCPTSKPGTGIQSDLSKPFSQLTDEPLNQLTNRRINETKCKLTEPTRAMSSEDWAWTLVGQDPKPGTWAAARDIHPQITMATASIVVGIVCPQFLSSDENSSFPGVIACNLVWFSTFFYSQVWKKYRYVSTWL